jgi:hypothetical protein
VNLAVERYPQNREPMMRIIESAWQAGEITLWGRRKGYAMPEPIREYRGLVISWHAGPPKGQYYAEAHAHPSQPGAHYHRHEWEDLAITKADLENLYGSRETDKALLRDTLERAADEILAKKSAEATPKLETTPPFSSANGLPRPTVRDIELRSWYANHIATSQPTSEALDWEIARRQFGTKVKREQVRALRRELAPESWRKQGRRKAAEKSAD